MLYRSEREIDVPYVIPCGGKLRPTELSGRTNGGPGGGCLGSSESSGKATTETTKKTATTRTTKTTTRTTESTTRTHTRFTHTRFSVSRVIFFRISGKIASRTLALPLPPQGARTGQKLREKCPCSVSRDRPKQPASVRVMTKKRMKCRDTLNRV